MSYCYLMYMLRQLVYICELLQLLLPFKIKIMLFIGFYKRGNLQIRSYNDYKTKQTKRAKAK